MDKPFQRKGAESNTQVGRDFEAKAQHFFAQRGLHLSPGIALEIGINGRKLHNFDLGDKQKKFVLRDFSEKRNETLGEYYIRTNHHLIPKDVEVWEYDDKLGTAKKIK
jgi:hypothetical protein